LGVNSVLHHVALARQQGLQHVYLGYWVEQNASLAYKAGYGPHELLVDRPDEDGPECWQAGPG
jgi:arginine-tRNA-protein transferase